MCVCGREREREREIEREIKGKGYLKMVECVSNLVKEGAVEEMLNKVATDPKRGTSCTPVQFSLASI